MFARASGRARAGVRTAIHRSGAAAAVRALLLLLVASGAACDAPAARDDTASTIVAVDDAGDTLRLAAPAQRIVSTVPAQTQILLALGAGDRIIARTDFDTQPELAHLPSTGNGITPNVEWIAAQRPDLVISWADTQSRSVIARLSALGIPAYASAVETIDDILRSIERLGALTDRDAAADSIVHDIRQELEAVARDVANSPRTRVMYVIGIEPLMVAGPRTFVDEALTIAGGDNVFGDTRARWPVVSIEEVIRRDPEVIIVGLGRTAAEADSVTARLRTAPGWRELRAVREGRVHWADPYEFNRPSPTIGRSARRFAEMLSDVGPSESEESAGRAAPGAAMPDNNLDGRDGPDGPHGLVPLP